MTRSESNSEGRGQPRRSRWRTVFWILLVMLLVAGALAVPGLRRAGIASNETAAIGTLRTLSTSMSQFQGACIVDQDGDGVGEFGWLTELAGILPPRGPRGTTQAAPTSPGFINPVMGTTARAGGGIAKKSGYYFLVYLPTASGVSMRDRGSAGVGVPADADNQEVRFLCYAWPVSMGITGNRAFVVSQQGEVFSSPNRDAQNYDALRRIPSPGAALVAVAGENASNLEGQLVAGTEAADQTQWLPAG